MSRVRDVHPIGKLAAQVLESHVMRGRNAQRSVDELLEVCRCGHVRAAHAGGRCCELACECGEFTKAVRS